MKFAKDLISRAARDGIELPNQFDSAAMTAPQLIQLRATIADAARAIVEDFRTCSDGEAPKIDRMHSALMTAFSVVDAEIKLREVEGRDADQRAARRPHAQAIEINAAGGHAGEQEFFTELRSGDRVPLVRSNERVQDFIHSTSDEFSLSSFVRSAMGVGEKRATSGSETVPTLVGSQIIDAVRKQSRLVEAGAGTIGIEAPTTLARIASDATVVAHVEGAADIAESDITLEPVTLNPAALVSLVPLSNELVEDSANLDAALRTSMAAAFARKLDQLAVDLILASSAVPTNTVARATNDWTSTVSAIGDALAADQDVPSALIANAADFAARAGQLASTAGSWLGRPPFLQGMLDLPTTAIDAGSAIFGDFARAIAMAARTDLRLEVIRFQKPGSYSHLLVAHARLAPVLLQPKRLFVQQTTVA